MAFMAKISGICKMKYGKAFRNYIITATTVVEIHLGMAIQSNQGLRPADWEDASHVQHAVMI